MFDIVRALVAFTIMSGSLCEPCLSRRDGRRPSYLLVACGVTLGFFWLMVTGTLGSPTTAAVEALCVLAISAIFAFLVEKALASRSARSESIETPAKSPEAS